MSLALPPTRGALSGELARGLRYDTREHESARVSVNKRMRMRVSAGERTATGKSTSTARSHSILGHLSLCNTRPVGVRMHAWRNTAD